MALVIEHNELDLKILYLDIPKKDESGKFYVSHINYNYGPMYMQSSKLKINNIDEKENGDCFITFNIQKDDLFYKSLKEMESKFIDIIDSKSEKWFKKKLPREFIVNGYNSIFIENETGILLTLPFRPTLSKKILTGVFNQYKKPLYIKDIKLNSAAIIIIEPICLKINAKNIELCLQVIQMEIKTARPVINSYAIRQHSDNEFDEYFVEENDGSDIELSDDE